MEIQTNTKARRAWVKVMLSLVVITLASLTSAKASVISNSTQMDPGRYILLQNGIRVGEIFVPQRDLKTTQYVEHWVLYNSYVYASPDHPELKTEIRVDQKSGYESEADFFARVPWGPGFRYVRVDCTESDKLPGR